jgi:hypothetical protein
MSEEELRELWEAIYRVWLQVEGLDAMLYLKNDAKAKGYESLLVTEIATLPQGIRRDAAFNAFRKSALRIPKAQEIIESETTT